MKININTAIIPIAGKGSRLMPLTLKTDKSFIKINNKPVLWYILKEAVDSKINKIIVVVNPQTKKTLDQYILEHKKILLKNMNIKIVVQKKLLGLANSIILASKYVNEKYFALMLGDNIFEPQKPALLELISRYQKDIKNVIGVVRVPLKENNQYGIVEQNTVIEKPKNSKSNLAIMGRYILSKNIFSFLEKNKNRINLLSEYFNSEIKKKNISFYKINSQYFDTGSIIGLKKAKKYFE